MARATRAVDAPTHDRLDGRDGWLVVAATFVSTFTVFGVAYSFGAFFGPMADEFGTDRGSTALVFSLTTFLYFTLGLVTGRVADRIGPRRVLAVGAAFLVLGLLVTSRVGALWIGYLTYGVGVGVGVACGYVPMVATVGGWFERRRTTALGVAVAGIGVGTLVMAPLAEWLVDELGWRDAYVVIAIGSAVLLGLASVAARRAPVDVGAEPPAPSTLARDPDFRRLYLSALLMSLVLFVPFVFMSDYLEARSVSGSAGWIVGTIGSSSVVGRLGLGALATRVPVVALYRACFLTIGGSYVIWLLADDAYVLLLVFAIVMGVSYGGFIALSPAVSAETFGTTGLGGVLGALYTSAGMGGLVGPPLAGVLIDAAGYRTTIGVAIVVGLMAGLVLTRLGAERRAGVAVAGPTAG